MMEYARWPTVVKRSDNNLINLLSILQVAALMLVPFLSDALVSLIEAMMRALSPTKLAVMRYEVPAACTKCCHDCAQTDVSDEEAPITDKSQQKQLASIVVEVQLFTGKPLLLNASPTDTVRSLKQQIEDGCGWRRSDTRLLFGGKQLSDTQTLLDAEIANWSTLYLHANLSGGSGGSAPRTPATCSHKIYSVAPRQLYDERVIASLMDGQATQRVGASLQHLTNSCFISAVLQALCYSPTLQNYLADRQHSLQCTKNTCALCEVEKLLPVMLQSTLPVGPGALFYELNTYFNGTLHPGAQEDAQEYLRCLIQQMQVATLEEYQDPDISLRVQETSSIHKLFGGRLLSKIKCNVCDTEYFQNDAFLDISLPINDKEIGTVRSAFAKYIAPELLEETEKYDCSHCHQKQLAEKTLSIFEPPNILCLHLKRFVFNKKKSKADPKNYRGDKIDKFIHFEEVLDITELMSYEFCKRVSYNLFAVLVHSGTFDKGDGHYVTYIRTSNDDWYCMDDLSPTPRARRIAWVLRQNAYMLFYERNETKISYDTMPPTDARAKGAASRAEHVDTSSTTHMSHPAQYATTKTLVSKAHECCTRQNIPCLTRVPKNDIIREQRTQILI